MAGKNYFRDKCFLEKRCDVLQKTYYSCAMATCTEAVVSKKAFQTADYISNEFFSVLRGQSSSQSESIAYKV